MNKIKIKRKQGGKPELPLGGYGFVIGNGTSRQGLDLQQLMDYGVVYSCNWFFKQEFHPHVLVCSDEPMTKTVLKTFPSYAKRNWFYTWFPKPGSGAKKAPCPEKFAAGPMATELACGKHKKEKVFLIGIDFFGFGSDNKNANGKVNNLYAGMKHYVKDESNPAPTYRNWQRRFEWILSNYPDTEIYHVNPFEGKSPERLRGFDNFHQITFENLIDHLTNDAELEDILVKTDEDREIIKHINEDDVRAVLERQFAGQENIIYNDLMDDNEILKIRKQVTLQAKQAKDDAYGIVKILNFEIMVPVLTVREGNITRLATENEIDKMHYRERELRNLLKQSAIQKGFKGQTIRIVGLDDKPINTGGAPLPPPPPPSVGNNSNNLPPPPPPPTF